MNSTHKPLIWLHGEITTPPMSSAARLEAGYNLRKLQAGEKLSLPISRSMPSIGRRCHELRISDAEQNKIWRIIYRTDDDAILITEVFAKKTKTTPKAKIDMSKSRIKEYDNACR